MSFTDAIVKRTSNVKKYIMEENYRKKIYIYAHRKRERRVISTVEVKVARPPVSIFSCAHVELASGVGNFTH